MTRMGFASERITNDQDLHHENPIVSFSIQGEEEGIDYTEEEEEEYHTDQFQSMHKIKSLICR